jgi:hypothetical protein
MINIVISGLTQAANNESCNGGSNGDKGEVIKILEAAGIQNAECKIIKLQRLPKSRTSQNDRPAPLVVELCDRSTRDKAVASSKELKKNSSYDKVFINPDLTPHEMELERELRRRRNAENNKLECEEGRLKYGKTQEGKEFYWGIRSGRLCRIERQSQRILPTQ